MDISKNTIGVIGYGNFGKVICNTLFPHNKIVLYTTQKMAPSERVSVTTSLSELAEQADVIIPAVPIRNFEKTIKKLAKIIRPQTVVMDICSIKEYPARIMQQYLPNNPLIASHPMFGPNSIAKKGSISHMNYVLHNISASSIFYDSLKKYLEHITLDVIEMTPEEHDRLAAKSQFFTLTVGEVYQQMRLMPTTIDTPGSSALFDALQFSGTDRHIIVDMIAYNRFCKPILYEFIRLLQGLEENK